MSVTKFTAEANKQEIIIEREFDAPRELVFKAFTDPELYVQWLGPQEMEMTLEKFEPVSGGGWHYTHEDKTGKKFGFHGVYHEVLFPERMIDTFEFEGLPERGHVSFETAKFSELPNGRSKVNIQTIFQTVGDRDMMIQTGMEKGMNESFERLDELLARINK